MKIYLILTFSFLPLLSFIMPSHSDTTQKQEESYSNPYSGVEMEAPLNSSITISWSKCNVVSKTTLTGSIEWQLWKVYQGQIQSEWLRHTGGQLWRVSYPEPDDFVIKARVIGTTTWTTSRIYKPRAGCCCP